MSNLLRIEELDNTNYNENLAIIKLKKLYSMLLSKSNKKKLTTEPYNIKTSTILKEINEQIFLDIIQRDSKHINIFIKYNTIYHQVSSIDLIFKCLSILDNKIKSKRDNATLKGDNYYSKLLSDYFEESITSFVRANNIHLNKSDTELKNLLRSLFYALSQISYTVLRLYYFNKYNYDIPDNKRKHYYNTIIINLNDYIIYKFDKVYILNMNRNNVANIMQSNEYDICINNDECIYYANEIYIKNNNLINNLYKFDTIDDSDYKLFFINTKYSSYKQSFNYWSNNLLLNNNVLFLNKYTSLPIIKYTNLTNNIHKLLPNIHYKLHNSFSIINNTINEYNKPSNNKVYYFTFNVKSFETGATDYNFNLNTNTHMNFSNNIKMKNNQITDKYKFNNTNENTYSESNKAKITSNFMVGFRQYLIQLFKCNICFRYKDNNDAIKINSIDYKDIEDYTTLLYKKLKFEDTYTNIKNGLINYLRSILKNINNVLNFKNRITKYNNNISIYYSINTINYLIILLSKIYNQNSIALFLHMIFNPRLYTIHELDSLDMPYYILLDLESNIIYKNNYYSVIDNASNTEYIYETITWFTLLNTNDKSFNLIIRQYHKPIYIDINTISNSILFLNL